MLSGKQSITTVFRTTSSSFRHFILRARWPQPGYLERIRMQATTKDLNTQEFFQPHIAEMDMSSKMLHKCELTRLVGSFEHGDFKPEFLCEAIRIGGVQRSIIAEHSHSLSALTRLDDELHRASIKPGVPSCDCFVERLLGKGTFVLLAHFILDFKPPLMRHLHYRACFVRQFREALPTFDACNTEVCAQVKVCLKLSLGHGYLKRTTSCNRRYIMSARRRYLPPRCCLVSNLPARHRYLQRSHEV